uniref:Uncharacterized protein n=1 Tax=Acrobeloides nanus TaxID=290746 RepID=A0A914EEC6_9BILA
MARWCVLVLLVGITFTVIAYVAFERTTDLYSLICWIVYNYAILINAYVMPLTAIMTNAVWKKEFMHPSGFGTIHLYIFMLIVFELRPRILMC